jgi:hypothetical protein
LIIKGIQNKGARLYRKVEENSRVMTVLLSWQGVIWTPKQSPNPQ